MFELSPLIESFGSLEMGLIVCLILGFCIGIISAMFGIGGGFIITPFFHAGVGLSASHSVSSSTGQIPLMAAMACWDYYKKNLIEFKAAIAFLITAVPSAQVIAHYVILFETSVWGSEIIWRGHSRADVIVILSYIIIIGLFGIYNVYKSYQLQSETEQFEPLVNVNKRIYVDLSFGLIFGASSALLGIGGGFLAVPYFLYVHGLKPVSAVATSMFCIFITSSITTLHYLWSGEIFFGLSLILALGSILGVRIGTRIAVKLPAHILFKLFAGFQLCVLFLYCYFKI